MRTDYLYIYIMALLAILPTTLPAQNGNEKIRVYGKITDASTNETMPYTSVRIRNTSNGCSSDNNGNFSFFVNALRDTLIVSSVGYAEERIPLNRRTRMPIRVKLKPTDYNLREVTIKPKKEKYRKKDNPAVILARNIIKRRNNNSPTNKPFYSRDRHEKLNLALNNFDSNNSSLVIF